MKTLDELDALHAAATAGEWVDYPFADTIATTRGAVKVNAGRQQIHVCETRFGRDGDPDCRAIVALKNNWPAFSARLRAAEAEVERLRGALRAMVDTYPTAALVTPSRFSNAVDAARAALGEP